MAELSFCIETKNRTVTNYVEKEKTAPFPKTQASFRTRSAATVNRSVSSQQRTVTNYIEKEKTEPFPKTQASFRTRSDATVNPTVPHPSYRIPRPVLSKKKGLHRQPPQHSILLILKNTRSPCQHRILVVAKKTSLNASSSQHRNLVISKKI